MDLRTILGFSMVFGVSISINKTFLPIYTQISHIASDHSVELSVSHAGKLYLLSNVGSTDINQVPILSKTFLPLFLHRLF